MDENFKWLFLGEIIIILILCLIKFILHLLEKHKVNKILKFIDKQTKKNNTDKFIECINIIKNKEDNYNGRN